MAPKPHQLLLNQRQKGRDDVIRAITSLQIKTDHNNEAYNEVMKEVDVVNTARSFNYLTGAKSRRGQGASTPTV